MMHNVPESVLLEALDFLERGESIEQIITRFPEVAPQLRLFLETATQLATAAPQPSLSAKQKSQELFLEHAASLKVAPLRPSPWYRLRQILLPIASLALVLILFVSTAVSVSASAIPGDALYSIKRLVETVRLNQATDPETAVALMEQFREERIREVQVLLRTGRTAEVTFEGIVNDFQDNQWTVATIKVTVAETTEIVGTPQIGELARVNGRTENGELFASAIQMLTGSIGNPEPTPAPEPMPTPTLAPTIEEPSATSTPVPTQPPTESPTATSTATALPTSAEPPTPTVSPTDDNGDDDNENDDDGNENGGNDNDDDDNNNNGGSGGNDNDDDNDNDDNENEGNDNDDNENDNDDDDDSGNGNGGSGNDNDDDNENDDNDNDDNDNDDEDE